MKICKGIYLEVVGAGCWVSRGLMLEDEAQRPPSYCSLHRLQVGRWSPCHVLPTLEINNRYMRVSI